MNTPFLDYLLSRRSAPIPELTGPAPSQDEIDLMLQAAIRVPDHGRLAPWRFILYRGDARIEAGRLLAERAEAREGVLNDARRQQELTRFSRAPLVIGVVFTPKESLKIPQWEMFVSAGMAAMNLIHAANALGYHTNLISNWYSDDAEGKRILGLAPDEQVIGFIHIGRHVGGTADRPRPDFKDLTVDYAGPWQAKADTAEG